MISKNAVIGFLIFTAVLLSCILVIDNLAGPGSAYASSPARAGAYVVTTARLDETTDLLWVVDVDTQNLSVFGMDNNGFIAELARVDLGIIFAPLMPLPLELQAPLRRGPGRRVAPQSPSEGEEQPLETPSRRPRRTQPQ